MRSKNLYRISLELPSINKIEKEVRIKMGRMNLIEIGEIDYCFLDDELTKFQFEAIKFGNVVMETIIIDINTLFKFQNTIEALFELRKKKFELRKKMLEKKKE